MVRRTLVLFGIFSAVAVGGLLFMAAYNGLMGAWLQSYVLQIRPCSYLSEALCERHPGCQAYYEGSQGNEFRECRALTAETAAAGDVCSKTGGDWQRTKFGLYCDCTKVNKNYVVDKGCQ